MLISDADNQSDITRECILPFMFEGRKLASLFMFEGKKKLLFIRRPRPADSPSHSTCTLSTEFHLAI